MRHAYVGQVCWTALSAPGGLVEVVWVAQDGLWGDVVQVRHVLDHPYGYARETVGWYALRDLQPCSWPEAEDTP